MAATSSANAPWYIILADSKRHRDLFLAELLVHTLGKMDLAASPKSFALSTVQLNRAAARSTDRSSTLSTPFRQGDSSGGHDRSLQNLAHLSPKPTASIQVCAGIWAAVNTGDGGCCKSSSSTAASNCGSRLTARSTPSGGKRRDFPVQNRRSVRSPVKPLNAPTAAPRRPSLRPAKSWCAGL